MEHTQNRKRLDKETVFIKYLTLVFGIFLLFTDVFFLGFGIIYDLPLIRYLIYVKLVINSTNIFLILKKHYLISTVIIYSVIMAMMIVGVISLGTEPMFQLYAVGMLICISYNSYLHSRVLKKHLPMFLTIAIHILAYVGVYIYARMNEPLYSIPRIAENVIIAFNSLATFTIVVLYTCLFYYVAINSEERLEKMALIDNLTGLYNRHYLLAYLDARTKKGVNNCWLAIMDVDDFKRVNDTYGHNCGDYVLHHIAEMSKQICKDCIVCRWGGEEFIFFSRGECDMSVLDTLRERIAGEEFKFGDKTLGVTVTIGASCYDSERTNDSWISDADEKLYYGKKNGKNQVVTDI
ncbi:MAG: GGDEF domain-containing protein [Lachnospiraceae bacterium]|nr:GGDEF domain-containing protein [Lachnospiraceae bacterium]